jgi:putative membrane protein
MLEQLPYCGSVPHPGELLTRFNPDPVLMAALAAAACWHLYSAGSGAFKARAATGWLVATAAFVSPLCALSVALFSARVGQHMILILLAAPLIASALPVLKQTSKSTRLWLSATFFFLSLWFWHMPVPYDATFASTLVYWTMHLMLFGSAILLWRELLNHQYDRLGEVLVVGALTSMQMGLLGAILTFATHPLFLWHLTTTWAWGLTPLRDQQLGGVFMWVPGILFFVWAAVRSVGRVWTNLERAKAA